MTSSYFNFDDADVILRSAAPYATEFRVHKSLLSAASPFFKHMFALPQAPHSVAGPEVPVIDVSEPKSTLETLLRYVYPMSRPSIDTLDELTPVLEAAMKYDIISVIDILRKRLVSPDFARATPTRVYAIACRFDLEEEAKEASRYTLNVNVLDCPLHDDLKHITAYAYHRLLDLHRKRAKAAQELLQLSEDVKCMQCNGARYHAFLPPKWWTDFHERAKQELAVRPTADVVFSMPFLAQSAQAGCERCAGSILDAHSFLDQLRKNIDNLPSTI
ncbi:uncharacterized protein C8Q71DRAFT_798084 [Rhodofomes roseus]|uniref:BTB domain-containing protein n=1 Tax=Rhodofomes roseus TaxID=34475 RepID=A0A4Y9XXT4_9APHY|nr:uncharacterized protein C8Q71DRAFT_798084 [Rhodofomes roseus]KAH9833768.1 hypothetical protein C8Q71DRAFT_798084 [Rhodofomes roseus]TFY53961.1 hypothetical protein EVJ58_g9144 [Rhodofomes roseus]